MSRKTTAALVAAMGINFALAGGALMLANLNKPVAYGGAGDLAGSYGDTSRIAGVKADAELGDLIVPLKAAQQGGNLRIGFQCAKKLPGGREVHEGTWDQIGGAVLYRPEPAELRAIEAVFDTRSLRTDAQGLTTTVTAKEKWFDIDNHPIATFTCDTVRPVDAATSSHTHDLVGTFTLNGIARPITIPAALAFAGQSLTIDAEFTILRSDYGVAKRESSIAGSVGGVVSEVEDAVQLSVRVTASPDPAAVISELAKTLELQQEELRLAKAERQRLLGLDRQIELLQDKVTNLASQSIRQGPAVDVDALPKVYTDFAEGNDGPVPFGMVLVQGDANKDIDPFYMATHEVTWGMFARWMYCTDLEQAGVSPHEIAKLILAGRRPSPLYEDPAQFVEVNKRNNPAMSMSLLTAKSYCEWLSEKTGRRYRLPTIGEWRHAMRQGGGLPEDLDPYVWHEGNVKFSSLGREVNAPAGSKKPNAIGIHDMFGSVAEWVIGTGADRVIVGGSFITPEDEISETWQMIEDQSVWNETYPQLPISRFWYSDVYFTGIRLVCEPASVTANPPKAGE